jgi:hypothetical protein
MLTPLLKKILVYSIKRASCCAIERHALFWRLHHFVTGKDEKGLPESAGSGWRIVHKFYKARAATLSCPGKGDVHQATTMLAYV